MTDTRTPDRVLWTITAILLGLVTLAFIAAGIAVTRGPLGAQVVNAFNALFAIGQVQTLWYITRAAGLIAYLLLWLSTVWGLAVTSKIFDPLLQRAFTYDMHQFLSLLAIGFTAIHLIVLLGDKYLPFTLAELFIPFVAPYRPVWVGIGIIGLYLTLLVTLTFYIRTRIGTRAFRLTHYASFGAYLAVTLHGLFAGTDAAVGAIKFMYAGTALAVVFLTVYWLAILAIDKRAVRTRATG